MEVGLFLRLIIFLTIPFLLHGGTLTELLKERYEKIETLEASFRQKLYISSIKKERLLEGKFFYKKGKGFLWKYERPDEKIYLFDGTFLWQEEKKKNYVIKERVKKEERKGTFFDLVEDFKRIDEIILIKGEYEKEEEKIIEALPRKEEIIKTIRLYLDRKTMVRRLELYEITGNSNIIEFSDIKINEGIEDGIFIYRPKRGKEIRERN